MTVNLPKRQDPQPDGAVIDWLLDSDPSIRWQVLQDLTGASVDEVASERARVATQGAGAHLLALQGGAAWNHSQTTATMNVNIGEIEEEIEKNGCNEKAELPAMVMEIGDSIF